MSSIPRPIVTVSSARLTRDVRGIAQQIQIDPSLTVRVTLYGDPRLIIISPTRYERLCAAERQSAAIAAGALAVVDVRDAERLSRLDRGEHPLPLPVTPDAP